LFGGLSSAGLEMGRWELQYIHYWVVKMVYC